MDSQDRQDYSLPGFFLSILPIHVNIVIDYPTGF